MLILIVDACSYNVAGGVAQMDEHNRKIIFWLADDIADSPNLDRINVTDHKPSSLFLIPDLDQRPGIW